MPWYPGGMEKVFCLRNLKLVGVFKQPKRFHKKFNPHNYITPKGIKTFMTNKNSK
jgi:hypothetical protein